MHRLGGYGILPYPRCPPNYLPTEHTETTGGEEKSVGICKIRGRLFSTRSFCEFGEICGRASEGGVGMAGMPYPPTSVGIRAIRGRIVMLVQRGPLHPLKIAMLQQQDCHATTTRLPRYDNKIATLRQDAERRMEDKLEDRLADNPCCSGIFQSLLR